MKNNTEGFKLRKVHFVAGAVALGGIFYGVQGVQKAFEQEYTDAARLTYATSLFEGSAGLTFFGGKIRKALLYGLGESVPNQLKPEEEIIISPDENNESPTVLNLSPIDQTAPQNT